MARHRRDLAQPGTPLAERRLGLRRRRLHGHPPRSRHARGPRPARRRSRGLRNQGAPRSRPEPLVRSAPVVSRAARLLRLVGRGPEQLGVDLRRRLRLDLRRRTRPVLPAQLRAAAARPQLVEPGGRAGVRADPAVLVRPRRRRIPHRRRARDLQGPGAARRSGDPGARHASPLLDVPPGDARGPARHGARSRRPTTRRGSSSARRTRSKSNSGPDTSADGDQLDLAFAFMLTHANLDADEMRGVVAEIEAALPADAWPCWAGLEPRHRPPRHALGSTATTRERAARS